MVKTEYFKFSEEEGESLEEVGACSKPSNLDENNLDLKKDEDNTKSNRESGTQESKEKIK